MTKVDLCAKFGDHRFICCEREQIEKQTRNYTNAINLHSRKHATTDVIWRS